MIGIVLLLLFCDGCTSGESSSGQRQLHVCRGMSLRSQQQVRTQLYRSRLITYDGNDGVVVGVDGAVIGMNLYKSSIVTGCGRLRSFREWMQWMRKTCPNYTLWHRIDARFDIFW